MNLLFQDIDALEQYDTLSQVEYDNIKPHIEDAQQRWLKPVLGTDFIAELAGYALSNPTHPALQKAQAALAPLAVALYIPENKAKITPSGMQATVTQTSKTAYAGDVQDMIEHRLLRGGRALEYLLDFLIENIGNYANWLPVFEQMQVSFVQKASDINRAYNINANRYTYVNLIPAIKRAENTKLKDYLGEALFEEMQQAQINNTSNHASIIELAKECVSLQAIAYGIAENTISTSYSGNWVLQSFEAVSSIAAGRIQNALNPQERYMLQEQMEKRASAAFQRLRNLLTKLADDGSLDVHKNSDAYVEAPKRGFRNTASTGRKFYNGLK